MKKEHMQKDQIKGLTFFEEILGICTSCQSLPVGLG